MEAFLSANALRLIIAALLAASEVLALTPLKSNSVFQLAVTVLRKPNFTGAKTSA